MLSFRCAVQTAAGATQHKALTAEGTIVGTFQYMAPEQLEGLDADPRSVPQMFRLNPSRNAKKPSTQFDDKTPPKHQ